MELNRIAFNRHDGTYKLTRKYIVFAVGKTSVKAPVFSTNRLTALLIIKNNRNAYRLQEIVLREKMKSGNEWGVQK